MIREKQKKTSLNNQRTQQTRQTIRSTVLSLLEHTSFSRLTVTEVCRRLEINRGTFYLHYYDLEDVLDDILDEMLRNTAGIFSYLFHPEQNQESRACALCTSVHGDLRYRFLFLDVHISARILKKISAIYKEDYVTYLMSHSLLTFQEAEAIFCFQMNGCLAVNRMMLENHCPDWRQIQRVLDGFIRAGMEHYLIHDQRDENGWLPDSQQSPADLSRP